MKSGIKGKSLLTLLEFSDEEIRYLLNLALDLKKSKPKARFAGKTLAMIFEKRSTRTRCAFETAFGEEGGHPVFLSLQDIQLGGGKETIEDTARVLGRMFSGIQFRGFKQETLEALAKYSGVPVYNGLTDLYHPTQILADLMTVQEEFGSLAGLKLCFLGDARNNVARSLSIGCAKMGMHFTAVSPKSLFPDEALVNTCARLAENSGGSVSYTEDLGRGVDGAHAVYTDVWTSMGEDDKAAEREALLKPFQVNLGVMEKTGRRDSIFLHCLPAIKGKEVTEDVFEGPASRVWDEAENRKHTIKSIMLATLA